MPSLNHEGILFFVTPLRFMASLGMLQGPKPGFFAASIVHPPPPPTKHSAPQTGQPSTANRPHCTGKLLYQP